MKLVLVSFITLLSINVFSDESSVINLQDRRNTCFRILEKKRPIRLNEISRSIFIFNFLNDIPQSTLSHEFFNRDLDPETIFVFSGKNNPTFGRTGVEEWKRLDATQLDFRNDLFFMKREMTEGGDYRFTEQTRFHLDEVSVAFVELLNFFKVVTGTVGVGSGVNYIDLFSAKGAKEQIRSLITGWATSVDKKGVDLFSYEANQIIGDPSFDADNPRHVRVYFNRIVETFKKHFGKISGFNYKYEIMLDNLEKRRLLHYYILI